MGIVVFIFSAAIALSVPAWVPAWLILGLAWDHLLPGFGLHIYSNEWALAGACLGLAARQIQRPQKFPPAWTYLSIVPAALLVLAHGFWPGPLGSTLKSLLRVGQFWLGFFLPLVCLREFNEARKVYGFSAFLLILFCLLAVAQAASGPGSVLNAGRGDEVYGTFEAAASCFQHHNQFSAYLAAGLPLLLAGAAAGVFPALSLAAFGFGLLGLVLSFSRGAWVGLGVAALSSVFFTPAKLRHRIFVTFALLVVALLALGGPLRTRLLSSFSGSANQDRLFIARQGLAIWQEHYFWGRGAGSVERELPQRIAATALDEHQKRVFSAHLHNTWLQTSVEFGLVTVAAWLAFLGCLLWQAFRGTRALPAKQGLWAAALLAALLAFLAQSPTDLLWLHDRGLGISLWWGLAASLMIGSENQAGKG